MDIQKLMKQAQQMQDGMQKTQEELANKNVEASVGGGKVTVVANGAGDVNPFILILPLLTQQMLNSSKTSCSLEFRRR